MTPTPVEALRERERFEQALKQTWQMVDPLNPPGRLGSFVRGEYVGICAALQTMRENYDRLASLAVSPEPPVDEREAFEAWLLEEQGLDATWNEQRNCYDEFAAHIAYKAWKCKAWKWRAALGHPVSAVAQPPGAASHGGDTSASDTVDETPAELALRSLASWLGNGGYNAPTVDAAVFEAKIRDGVEHLTRVIPPIVRQALQEADKCMSEVKAALDAPLRDGDPVHPLSAKLTWPLSTVALALNEIAASSEASRPQTSAPGGEGTAQGGWAEPAAWIDPELHLDRPYGKPTSPVTTYEVNGWEPLFRGPKRLTDAARDVLAERERQVSVEGWTPEHDDAHDGLELAFAASCYCVADAGDAPAAAAWPWDWSWWKPKDHRSNLVKAGALILAEIERLDRIERASRSEGEQT